MLKEFLPRIVSWNTTLNCNLRCAHCYINAHRRSAEELDTTEGKRLIDQIAEVSKPILVLSGGEPLLREDIFELAHYATKKGLTVGLGTNGTLITIDIAKKLKEAGVKTVAVSLDSVIPEKHDRFRGINGAWEKAIKGIKACRDVGLEIRINTTVTRENYDEIDKIVRLAEKVGAKHFHLFSLVPTGRAKSVDAPSPTEYERMIRDVLVKGRTEFRLRIRPVCFPQFTRIAKQEGIRLEVERGCIAGLWYCRINPTGDVTPCPYLPIKVGNIREKSFKEIWFNSEVFKTLRDFKNLKGRCGVCDFQNVCGGCRARAYGLTHDVTYVCGTLDVPDKLTGDYLAEDPWCSYQPDKEVKVSL